MSLYRELSYDNDFDIIKGIQFCIMSPEEITNRSIAEITKTETYNANKPVVNGLFDPRMGVIDYNEVCVTCQQKNTFCPGHFGHITLAKPVFYVQFFHIVLKLVKCVCFRCSKLLVDPESPEVQAIINKKLSRQKKWEAMYKLCSKAKRRCGQFTLDGCGAKIPTITKEGMLKISMEWKDIENSIDGQKINKKQIFNAEDILRILRRISDRDAEILGFSKKYNRPEWMICTVMPVPPPTVRPSVKTDTGMRQEDDLTSKLSMIVKVNNNLKNLLEKNSDKISTDQVDMLTMLLQYEVATMIDNTIPGIPQSQQRTGRPIRSLTERLKSKEGRIRGNLMGKRVDFSARSVITPDPNISIDELGVPIKIAMNLTFPEIVNKYNKTELYRLVRNGPDIYPGAKFIRKTQDGVTKRLKTMDRDSITLEDGDIVDRHLKNGDVVLFNRQPSLHRMSMMGHRIRVMPFQTFRLNVCVTPSFNADFDGDEMNMHVPQSFQTAEELLQLASVPTQIISPRECKPIVSIVQDIVSGLYRMTQDDVRVNEKQLWNLLCSNPKCFGNIVKPDEINGKIKKWSGRQLLSSILPTKVNVNIKTDDYNDDMSYEENDKLNRIVRVVNGEHISGIVSKDIYQSRTKGIIHQVYNEYGPEETRILFDNTQKLICDWLILSGFSVGVSDMIMNQKTNDDVKQIIHRMKVNVYDSLHDIHQGKFENNSIKSNHDLFETNVNTSLNKAIEEVGKKVKSQINEKSNRLINMIKSKAKGNNINVAQIMGCVGQQNVDGKRIPYGFDDRTLPHYTKYDDGPESRGFVENSFIKGLTPQEFFFHAMGGREGLIDTAVNSVTWETPVIIMEDGLAKYVKIGEWIDNLISENNQDVQYINTEQNMEFLKFKKGKAVYIPTCDKDGNITWGEMTAVTRHDPGKQLFEITTASGRSVIVTESKSLLIYKNGHFVPVPTSSVVIGDCVPVTVNLISPPDLVSHIKISEYLSKNTYVYGTDFNMALCHYSLLSITCGEFTHKIWNTNNGPDGKYHLPFGTDEYIKYALNNMAIENLHDDYVYYNDYHFINMTDKMYDLFKCSLSNGIIIGLLLSNGEIYPSEGIIRVSSPDIIINQLVSNWCTENHVHLDILHGLRDEDSYSLVMKSKVLSHFLCKFLSPDFVSSDPLTHSSMKNMSSCDMCLPDIAFKSSVEFIHGILKGYATTFAYETAVPNAIQIIVENERMLNGMSMLFSRIGMFTSSIKMVNGKYAMLVQELDCFKDIFTYLRQFDSCPLTDDYNHMYASINEFIDCISDTQNKSKSKTEILNDQTVQNDVILDPITSITLVDVAKYPKVYDVTVPSTLNFSIANGMGIVDTSETGYIQRKLVKAMEDCKVNHDMTVRNASGCIIQFLYGEDGMDSCKIESQIVDHVEMEIYEIQQKYNLTVDELEFKLKADVYSDLKKNNAKWTSAINAHVNDILKDREHIIVNMNKGVCNINIMYPIGFFRILTIAQNMSAKHKANGILDLNPMYILDKIEQLTREIFVTKIHNGNKLFQILVRSFLSPKKILLVHKLNRDSFDFVVQQIRFRFYESLAHPSEMVGVIAAQSIGEPSTQLTLNSFHGAGISEASKSVRGVPRLNELLGVSKNIKTPVMKIYLDANVRSTKEKCIQIMNTIRTVRFKDIIKSSKIYFEPDNFKSHIQEDQPLIDFYNEFMEYNNTNIESPWLLRLELDRAKMHEFNVDMITIHNVLDNFYEDKISCMFSDDNAKTLLFRIKMSFGDDVPSDDMLTDLKALEHNIIETLVIKGVKSIERAGLSEVKSKRYNASFNEENKSELFSEIQKQFYMDQEWIIYTAGTNLKDILTMDIVDSVRTITNDVNEVYEVLGVEAARQMLQNEIMDVLDSVYVNFRHIALLVDVMTNKGTILSVNRFGINRGDIGPLAKCSFEETTDKLIKAGIFAEYDKINGVAANVMLGQIPPCGTGDVDILIDETMLHTIVKEDDFDIGNDSDEEELNVCTDDILKIQFEVPTLELEQMFVPKNNNELVIED